MNADGDMSTHYVSCKRHTRNSQRLQLFVERSFAPTRRRRLEKSLELDSTPAGQT